MDNRYYDKVIGEMKDFFEENNFRAEDKVFKNDHVSVKIEYDEKAQTYNLLVAEIEEEKIGEYSVASVYLFDDSQLERDAAAVGIDFVDTLKKKLGIKSKRKTSSADIELPTTTKGSAVTINTLTSKLLAIYPNLKDTYKSEVEAKGKYLYLDFMMTYFAPQIRDTLENGAKKNIKKIIDMLTEMFIKGDSATSTAVVALLTSAIGKNEKRFLAAAEYMAECSSLISSVNNQISLLGKNKKFTEALKYKD